MAQHDEALWRAYCSGDEAAFAQLVRRYGRELFVFLVRFVNDAALAEDLVQETFLQVHNARETFDLTRAFRPWVYTVAANKARDRLRQIKRRPELLIADAEPAGGEPQSTTTLTDCLARFDQPPEASLEDEETAREVRALLNEMPDNLRQVLILAYFHQFPYQDIAGILECPVGTVKSRVHAAVKWFAEHWPEHVRKTG